MTWDIFKLDDDWNYWNCQIIKQLKFYGIDCLFADIWGNTNIAILVGVNALSGYQIAKALNIYEECVYYDYDHNFVILNLFQEKYLRGDLK